MRSSIKKLAFLVWIFLTPFIVPNVLSAKTVVDQTFTSPTDLFALINECCAFVAQTFTAEITGTLAGVNINIEPFDTNSPFPLSVAIHSVTINGEPDSTILGETTLSSNGAPLSLLITFPQEIKIVAGVQYAIVVHYEGAPPAGPADQGLGYWSGATGNNYPAGNWYSSIDGSSWFSEGLDEYDLHFQTYVAEDIAPLEVSIISPAESEILHDTVTFQARTTTTDLQDVFFSLREPDGGEGVPIGYEDMTATYNSASGYWEYPFDTTVLQDGTYVLRAKTIDNYGSESLSSVVPFSIRNWSVIAFLPCAKKTNAGRIMPVKFSLRIAANVDPAQPFVYNEDLEIRIYDASSPGTLLQRSVFGDEAANYRITDEMYITNFKTGETPATYVVEIWRSIKNFMVGSFTFETISRPITTTTTYRHTTTTTCRPTTTTTTYRHTTTITCRPTTTTTACRHTTTTTTIKNKFRRYT